MSSSPPATRLPPAARGDRNVAIDAPTSNTVIVTGDRNTVRMELGGPGAVLAFLFRWDRPRARRRRDVPCPPAFADHVDRSEEIAAVAGTGEGDPRVANVYGERGIGKTHILLAALNAPGGRAKHGRAYVAARDLDAGDTLHAIFDAFFTVRTPRRDLRIEEHLRGRRAVVALDDVQLAHADVQRLVLAMPRARLFIGSAGRTVLDGVPVPVHGLTPEHAPAIAAQELGHPLSDVERIAAEAIADAVEGHPVLLRQLYGVARDQRRPLTDVALHAARLVRREDRLAALSDPERAVARALSVYAGATVGAEHLAALLGPEAPVAAAALDARHDATQGSPRYRLVGALRGLEPKHDDVDRALRHFTAWAEEHAGDHRAVLAEREALLALVDRAADGERWADVIRLARAIEAALAWGRCWAAWNRVLLRVLAGASITGDAANEAWALHQLGTRAYGVGDAEHAQKYLEDAAAIRERLHDEPGLAATRQNLRVVTGRAPWPQRLSHASVIVVTALVVLLAGIGAFGGAALGDGRVPGTDIEVPLVDATETDATGEAGSEESEADPGTTTPTGTDRTTTTTTTAPPAGPFGLTVEKLGRGGPKTTVTSDPEGIACDETCEADFEDGEEVVLVVDEPPRHVVVSWSEASCGSDTVCSVVMHDDRTVSVTVEPGRPPLDDPPPTVPTVPTEPPPDPPPTIPPEPAPIG